MDLRRRQLAEQLTALERALARRALWGSEPPASEALASTLPFGCDRLGLHEWLQWIFIPRLRHMLADDLALPGNSNVASYAEEAWAELHPAPTELIALIREIDHLLTQH